MSQADADWMFTHEAQTTDVDHMAVTFRTEPRTLTELADAAYGLKAMPRVEIARQGQPVEVDEPSLEVLAGLMVAITRHVNARVGGIAYTPRRGGELEIKLATYRPPANP